MPPFGSIDSGKPLSDKTADQPVAYILKRYPRLSETFILNEIRAMERLGARIHIISLLPPEPPPHHPMVSEIESPVHTMPESWGQRWGRIARSHAGMIAAAPLRYARALARACVWSAQASKPLAVWKQFARGGFVAAICRAEGIRHIHAHFANTPTAAAEFASIMSGIPFSFTAHAKDIYLTPKPIISRRGRAADFVTTCTSYNVRYLAPLLGDQAGKIQLVYHGIDLDLFGGRAPVRPTAKGPPLILSVGRLVPKKGFDDLIAACALLRDAGADFRCRIVGAGPLRAQLEAMIAQADLAGIVTLEGAMTHAKLIALYGTADLFALAPRIAEDGDRDGIPNVIAEAMAIGVPVVSTDVSGIPELVRNDETGLLVPPHDPAALADAMNALLANPDLGARLAAAGRARLEGSFDLWKTTTKLHTLLGCMACRPDVLAAAASGARRLRADSPLMAGADQ